MKRVPRVADLVAARWRMSIWLGVVPAAMLGADEVYAAALPGSLTSPVGLLAALAAWLLVKAWSTPGLAEATAGIVAVAACGAAAAWLWRAHAGATTARATVGGIDLALRPSGPAAGSVPARCGEPAPAAVALPPGLAAAPLLHELRARFVLLQAAWDAGEVSALRALVTPGMLEQLCETWPGGGPGGNRTDVVTLHAELRGFEEFGDSQVVTVEYSGLIRECDEQGAVPFRELWMLARPKHGGRDWKLARQQALL